MAESMAQAVAQKKKKTRGVQAHLRCWSLVASKF